MTASFELNQLTAEPGEEWQRMLRFANLGEEERVAMARTVETLLKRATELVIDTYEYLTAVPETAAILGWEQHVDETHLEERRRFFTIWLARTLGMDTSTEFAYYLFRAGKYHAGHGPRRIHTPPGYVNASVGLVLAGFARYMQEAGLPANVVAPALAGWSKMLSVQLNQMLFGYHIAQKFSNGDFDVPINLFGRLRLLVGLDSLTISASQGNRVIDLLTKFFDYYPQTRAVALERIWHSDEKEDSLWTEVTPAYLPRPGWRVLLNGRDLEYEHGFTAPVQAGDSIDIFPPGR